MISNLQNKDNDLYYQPKYWIFVVFVIELKK